MDQADIDPVTNLSLSTIFLDNGATLYGQAVAPEIIKKGPRLSINNIFPNPTTSEITVVIHSLKEEVSLPFS